MVSHHSIGPVTCAIRAVRSEPEPIEPRDLIAALCAVLARFVLGAGTPVDCDAEISAPNQGGTL